MFKDKYGVEYSDDGKTLVKCPADFQGEFFVPDNISCIGDYAFENCYHLTGINISKDVKTIGANAFYRCLDLAEDCKYKDMSELYENEGKKGVIELLGKQRVYSEFDICYDS